LEKSDEREVLFCIKLCAETKLLVNVIGVYRNFLVCGSLLLAVLWLIGNGLS
jgi:hypothetical protein